jgi:hypothetical protein
MAIDNTARDHRKQQLETELLEIKIDELVEGSLERNSWFQVNIGLRPETSSFWTALPRYVMDCQTIPAFVTGTQVELFIKQAIQKYSRAYK